MPQHVQTVASCVTCCDGLDYSMVEKRAQLHFVVVFSSALHGNENSRSLEHCILNFAVCFLEWLM